MNTAVVCFPHQLFEQNPLLKETKRIYLVEDSLFFGDAEYPVRFHKKKLMFHRASMKYYESFLINKNYEVEYLEYQLKYAKSNHNGSVPELFRKLKNDGIKAIFMLDPVDWALEKRIKKEKKKNDIQVTIEETPGFLNTNSINNQYFNGKKSYQQTPFYIAQRKRLKILLVDGNAKGGKWTYDTENRKKISKDLNIPRIPKIERSQFLEDALKYTEDKFPDNPGNLENFFFPVSHQSAKLWFSKFLKERFELFGPYEDALQEKESILFHSVLSPLLNSGLLTAKLVIDLSLDYAKKNNIPMNSLEGFIRQIIGWREFMRAIYVLEGVKQRNSNLWNHTHPMPKEFYDASTGIFPVDNVIKRLLNDAYLHHIERLMILGNFMNLCEIDPKAIYKWFMELFIDAYDWVMVPNVYGMSLNADGGLITTKPYISSSNYILKMSDYKKGDWCDVWNGLYWRFIHKHQEKIKKNPRMSMMVKIIKQMDSNKLSSHLEKANNFLKKLHKI
ncbi:MAG: cryptochrome/photolyase family protein [Promethearchaeota archaeon]|nr:MAG: cryptochrome/photolyase family protein [Candidatus Lokiarchaeota archaeon]